MALYADFDGSALMGGDDPAGQRLGHVAQGVEHAFQTAGQLLARGEMWMLRACSLDEQRNWCKWDKELLDMSQDDARCMLALLDAMS